MLLAVPDMLCTTVSYSEALQLILEFSYPSHPTEESTTHKRHDLDHI